MGSLGCFGTLCSNLVPGASSWDPPRSPRSAAASRCYQKVQGGCIISYVGMLVTLTGMEMMAQGSPCCSRERLIMYLEE